MKKIITLIIICLLALPLISADLGTYTQRSCVNIRTILNTSSVNLTVYYPNGQISINGQEMQKNGMNFNYTDCDTFSLGVYTYNYNDAEGNPYVNTFTITTTGEEKTTDSSQYQMMLVLLYAFGMCAIYILVYKKNRFLGNMGYLMTSIGIMFSFPNIPIGLIIMGASFLSMIYDLMKKS